MTGLLDGKVAIITGAAGGLGKGAAEAMIREGAKVAVADINDALGEETVAELGADAIYVHTDVRDEKQIEALVAAAVAKFGRLDVMFNNAGAPGVTAPIVDSTSQGFLSTLELLAASALAGHKYAARQFITQGSGGSIITTSSIAGLQGGFGAIGYVAAKAAIIGMVRQAAYELGSHGIRSNAILPGIIATPIIAASAGITERVDEFTNFASDRLAGEQPIGRVGVPSDIGAAAVFLASDMSAFITGASLVVDGGATAVYRGQVAQIMQDALRDFSA